MELPQAFVTRMKTMLGSEYDAYIAQYDQEPVRGIRVNTLKLSKDEFLELCPWRVEQSGIIDGDYGEGMTVTSAMKGLAATVKTELTAIQAGEFKGGVIDTLGLVSENPDENYVQIPATTQFEDGKFTAEDYAALVKAMLNGEITVSNDISMTASDFAADITLNDLGNLK